MTLCIWWEKCRFVLIKMYTIPSKKRNRRSQSRRRHRLINQTSKHERYEVVIKCNRPPPDTKAARSRKYETKRTRTLLQCAWTVSFVIWNVPSSSTRGEVNWPERSRPLTTCFKRGDAVRVVVSSYPPGIGRTRHDGTFRFTYLHVQSDVICVCFYSNRHRLRVQCWFVL